MLKFEIMIWFRTVGYSTDIEEIEVLKETEHKVSYLNRYQRKVSEFKSSDSSMWHRTKEEALAYLLQVANDRVAYTSKRLQGDKESLAKLLAKYPELNL